jgi:hypothetical protein
MIRSSRHDYARDIVLIHCARTMKSDIGYLIVIWRQCNLNVHFVLLFKLFIYFKAYFYSGLCDSLHFVTKFLKCSSAIITFQTNLCCSRLFSLSLCPFSWQYVFMRITTTALNRLTRTCYKEIRMVTSKIDLSYNYEEMCFL